MNWKYVIKFTPYFFDDELVDFIPRKQCAIVLISDQELVDWFVNNGVNSCVHEVIVNDEWKDRDEY